MDKGTMTFNEWADKAVKLYAKGAMTRTGHRVIGTPHIFMGVMKEGPASNLLIRTFGVNRERVEDIIRDMPKPLPKGLGDDFVYTDGANKVLEKAQELSEEYGFKHKQIYTDHLLVALIDVNDADFAFILTSLGVDYDKLKAEATKALVWKSKLPKE